MDAQGTMRLMFDTMDAYDRADFDRLAEIYAEDTQCRNANPNGPDCHNRDDMFAMFRQRMDAGTRVAFDELRSTPTEVVLTARARLRRCRQRVQLPGAPHRDRHGLPLDGGRPSSDRWSKPGTGRAVVAPLASLAPRLARLIENGH
jgi:hypothetical protein